MLAVNTKWVWLKVCLEDENKIMGITGGEDAQHGLALETMEEILTQNIKVLALTD